MIMKGELKPLNPFCMYPNSANELGPHPDKYSNITSITFLSCYLNSEQTFLNSQPVNLIYPSKAWS
jgi:hypothetical protein